MIIPLDITDTQIGDGTAESLQTWVRDFVTARFPACGIESWGIHQGPTGDALRPFSDLPAQVDSIGAYVSPGRGEGRIIRVVLAASGDNGRVRTLLAAKSFGSADECWAIARAISEALQAIYRDRTNPTRGDGGAPPASTSIAVIPVDQPGAHVGETRAGFLATTAEKETSPELMEAIWEAAMSNQSSAEFIWLYGATQDEMDVIVREVTRNGRATTDFVWGASGTDWASTTL